MQLQLETALVKVPRVMPEFLLVNMQVIRDKGGFQLQLVIARDKIIKIPGVMGRLQLETILVKIPKVLLQLQLVMELVRLYKIIHQLQLD